jgi:hypothetical protein
MTILVNEVATALGLKTKPNMVVSAVMSVTGDTVNNLTISFEGASEEGELVYKTFEHYRGIVDASKDMAKAAGFPTDIEEAVGKATGTPAKRKKT